MEDETMNTTSIWRTRSLVGLAIATAFGTASGVANAADCASLANLVLPNTTVLEAETRLAGQNVITGTFSTSPVPGVELGHFSGNIPVPICRVRVSIKPTSVSNVISEYWLPLSGWNGKYEVTGGGGTAGSLGLNNLAPAVGLGYAAATTDTGHQSQDSTFALVRLDGVPEQVEDFAHRGYHVTTDIGKQVIQAFYGTAPNYSYFVGCSTGGAEALSELQRYPNDFNGIAGGAPASGYSLMWPGEVFPSWVSSTYTTAASGGPQGLITKLPALNSAALDACATSTNGAGARYIDDPTKCTFDPGTIQCAAGTNTTSCLTPDQVTAVRKIYAGFKDPTTGAQVWNPYMRGSEDQWSGHIIQGNSVAGNPPVNYFRSFLYQNPSWFYTNPTTLLGDNGLGFNMESVATVYGDIYPGDKYWAPYLDSIDPYLRPFQTGGGKVILYHGWKDQNIAPLHTVEYYRSVVANVAGYPNGFPPMIGDHSPFFQAALKKTQMFARLFMVPGMQHCNGGPGPNTFDVLGALVQWVENGVAPDKIIATHSTSGVVDSSRPLCPYPQVAQWIGTGSTNDAANFVCQNPS
jgi:feruloyl esterase